MGAGASLHEESMPETLDKEQAMKLAGTWDPSYEAFFNKFAEEGQITREQFINARAQSCISTHDVESAIVNPSDQSEEQQISEVKAKTEPANDAVVKEWTPGTSRRPRTSRRPIVSAQDNQIPVSDARQKVEASAEAASVEADTVAVSIFDAVVEEWTPGTSRRPRTSRRSIVSAQDNQSPVSDASQKEEVDSVVS